MVANSPEPGKKYYTAAQANAALPLVRVVVRDITELAHEVTEREKRLARVQSGTHRRPDLHQEEIDHISEELDRGRERMAGYLEELQRLGVELKDFHTGLIDFPCWVGTREVYLCWRLGEPEVAHWHEIDAGFAGRQKLNDPATRLPSPEVRAQG